MPNVKRECPDCVNDHDGVNRRDFLRTAGVAAVAASAWPNWAIAADTATTPEPESVVKVLYESLNDTQRQAICHDWDFKHSERGLLRTFVSNNWHINEHTIDSPFYTADQQAMIRDIYEGIIHPDWHKQIDKQLEDDAGGYGASQNIAIFGKPGDGKFELVMTGRHMTIRCDGNSAEHLAFGGPIFYGHDAAGTFNEDANHPGNVFWPQALEANKVFEMLDGRQRELALVATRPEERAVAFRGAAGGYPGIPITELAGDQKEQVQKVLQKLLEPYRQSDRDEVATCLKAQGGLDKCAMAFYREGDIGDDKVWDCWRLEGPSFVWYYRGEPHVHVWVNVAADPSVTTNS